MVSRSDENSFLTTKKGYPSGRKIYCTFKLIQYLKPDNWIKSKIDKFLKKKTGPMSENQWRNDIMDATGEAGEQLFNELVQRKILEPEGTKNNGNRYWNVYSLNKNVLAEELYNDPLGRLLVESSEFMVDNILPGRVVGKEF